MQKKCFNDTRAVLEGRQTMFRMEIKCPKNATYLRLSKNDAGKWWHLTTHDGIGRQIGVLKPRYKVGEVVAIAQSYLYIYTTLDNRVFSDQRSFVTYLEKKYKTDNVNFIKGWKNKAVVSTDLMPHHIKITDIKVEHLQDISKADCLKEGICKGYTAGVGNWYYIMSEKGVIFSTPRKAFAALIDKVSGRGTWEKNPYVFAYSFERVD